MTAREKTSDPSGVQGTVTVGEMRAWFQAEIGRLKSDVENLYDLVRNGDARSIRHDTKIGELDPIVSAMRDRVTSLESAVRRLDDDEGFLSTLDFAKFERDLDKRMNDQREAVRKEVGEKLKPVTDGLDQVKTKLNDMTVRFGIITALIVFAASKGVDLLMKALSTAGN